MTGPSEIVLAQYTWAQWKREAKTARARARRAAWIAYGIATGAMVWAGLANVEGTWRYSVIVYAPVLGLVVFEPTARAAMRRLFRSTGTAMRYRLVPALVPHASDAQLAQLAALDVVTIGSWHLHAVDTGKAVVVSVGHPAGGFGSTELVFGDVADSTGSVDFGGDYGGGFGGGGGGDGGGG